MKKKDAESAVNVRTALATVEQSRVPLEALLGSLVGLAGTLADCAELDGHVARLHDERDAIGAEVAALEASLAAAKSAHEQESSEYAAARQQDATRHAEGLRAHHAKVTGDLDRRMAEHTATIGADRQAHEQRVRDAQAQLAASREQKSQLASECAQLEGRVIELRATERQLRDEIGTYQQRVNRLAQGS